MPSLTSENPLQPTTFLRFTSPVSTLVLPNYLHSVDQLRSWPVFLTRLAPRLCTHCLPPTNLQARPTWRTRTLWGDPETILQSLFRCQVKRATCYGCCCSNGNYLAIAWRIWCDLQHRYPIHTRISRR